MSFNSRKLLFGSPNFTDPYWNNVSLLLHGDGIGATPNGQQNNTFLDSSSNNFTITRNGTPTQGSFSPYSLNGVVYSPSLNGGGAYFPGVNSNFLSVPSNAAFNFSSGTFTVECWIRANAVASGTYQHIVGNYNSTTTGWELAIDNKVYFNFSGDGIDIAGTTILQPNVWYHIAVSGSTGSYKLYVNGVQEGATYTGATSLAGGNLGIGAIGDRSGFVGSIPLNGYISNLRITNGAALYTGNFTPPTSPVTLTSNGGATPSTAPTSGQVALLCDFTNGGIFDNTKKNVLTTVGDAKVSTTQVKYGTGAMYFDGTGDRLTIPSSTNFEFGTGNFTIEFWAYCTNLAGGNAGEMGVVCFRQSSTNEARPSIFIVGNQFVYITNQTVRIASSTISANTWYHVTVSRSSGTTKMFVNGIKAGSDYVDSNSYLISGPIIGDFVLGGYVFNGYIDDLRITKGIARYTSNFTPPTRAFPNK